THIASPSTILSCFISKSFGEGSAVRLSHQPARPKLWVRTSRDFPVIPKPGPRAHACEGSCGFNQDAAAELRPRMQGHLAVAEDFNLCDHRQRRLPLTGLPALPCRSRVLSADSEELGHVGLRPFLTSTPFER